MTYAANHRALERLERTSGAKDDGWLKAVYALDREQRGALALARFAQELAGIEQPPREPVRDEPVREEPPAARAHPFAAPRAAPLSPGHPPVWGPDNRPSVHDVLTWEEAMRYFWLMENSSTDNDR